jgi:hypothetical protein
MPTGLKVVIVINIIATALIGVLAFGIGGGIELAVFPPNLPLEAPRLQVPVPSTAVAQSAASRRDQAVLASEAYDLAARRWEIRPDGSLQLHDDPRDLAIAVDSALSSGTVPQARTSIHHVEEAHQ